VSDVAEATDEALVRLGIDDFFSRRGAVRSSLRLIGELTPYVIPYSAQRASIARIWVSLRAVCRVESEGDVGIVSQWHSIFRKEDGFPLWSISTFCSKTWVNSTKSSTPRATIR